MGSIAEQSSLILAYHHAIKSRGTLNGDKLASV